MFDAHVHLDFLSSENRRTWVSAARSQGVTGFAVPGIRPAQWATAYEAARMADSVFGIGVHPSHTEDEPIETLIDALHYSFDHERPSFIGETGLDRFSPLPAEQQTRLFAAHVSLARAQDLPLVVHVVQKHAAVIDVLKSDALPRGGLIHGFVGSLELAQNYTALGFLLGIGKRSLRSPKTLRAIRGLALPWLVTESDEPGPETDVPGVVQEIARLHGVAPQTVEETSEKAAHRLFR